MIRSYLCRFAAAVLFVLFSLGGNATELEQQLRDHVRILASDSLQGRGLGTQGAERARNYIIQQFREAGIEPLAEDYLQPFNFRQNLVWVDAWNIVGVVRGTDPVLRNEYILIGAHYDHLGFTMDGDSKRIFPGADDNASGVAAIIEIGRHFAQNPDLLGRSLIIVAFDAEESGLLGSRYFVNHAPVPLVQIRKMFSLDMVGMYAANNGVHLRGISSLVQGDDLARELAGNMEVSIRRTGQRIERRTDTAPFGDSGIPATHVFTGQKSPYHKPGDQYHLLDYQGMARVVVFMNGLLAELSVRPVLEPASSLPEVSVQSQAKRRQGVAAGALVNIGSGFHRYPDEFFTADALFAFSAGLYLQVPLTRLLTLQGEAHYDRNASMISGGEFYRHSVTFPLNIQIGTPGGMSQDVRLFYFAGPYYRYSFAGKVAGEAMDFDNLFRNEEWGYSMGVGMNIFRVYIGYTSRRALTSLSRLEAFDLRDSNGYFTLGYRF